MGDINIGDKVITPNGNASTVIGTYPQGEKDIYRIYFKDGRFTDCCEDHLWKIYNYRWKRSKNGAWKILSLKELNEIIKASKTLKSADSKKFFVPLINSVSMKNLDTLMSSTLPVHPYLLGLLIGDGCMMGTSLKLSTPDQEIVNNVKKILIEDYCIQGVSGASEYDYNIKKKDVTSARGNYYISKLKEIKLHGKKSYDKFIPQIYKDSSPEEKIQLIRGLLDTDGTVDKCGSLSYSTTSYTLALDIQEILWSIGAIAKIKEKQTYYTLDGVKKAGRLSYNINIRYDYPEQLVTLSKKRDRINGYQYQGNLRLQISNIEYIGKYEAKCILIDDNEHLYITDNYIVTHNTYFVANNILKYYNEINASNILFVTSRSMIVDQQSKLSTITKFNPHDDKVVRYWNGEYDDEDYLKSKGIFIMTYDKIISILINKNNEENETLKNIKLVVLDECHTIFSDTFIKDMEALKVWIRDCLYRKNKIFIGMTATPNIINYYNNQWGVKINQLNKDVITRYKAKQLTCTNFETIPYIIATNRLQGKTLIMCSSINECIKLQDQLSNAAILVSKNNEYYNHDSSMWQIRQCIIEKEILPDTFMYPIKRNDKGYGIEFEERNLEILITTSTLREGVNLREESGVRNIICCFQDELHISQFMGRCRYDIDNLVVADTYVRSDNFKRDDYIVKCRDNYRDYVYNKTNIKWFDDISHLVEHDSFKTKRFMLGTDEKIFIDYINNNWLVPIGTKETEIDQYKIWKQNDKDEIVSMAVKCKLYPLFKSQVTFNKVMGTLTNTLGYEIESGRQSFEKKQHTYKLIISFDEEKLNFEKPCVGIDE